MCGRYASFRQAQDLADAFDVEEVTASADEVAANYNIAPTDGIRIIVDRAHQDVTESVQADDGVRREMHLARWGLVPAWAKDPSIGSRMINARSESLAEKSAFRKPLQTKRCIVVADGYYEWQKREVPGAKKPVKTPFFIHPTDDAPIAFAGLYSWWPDPTKGADDPDRWLLSATIITSPARDGLEKLHDREPTILTRKNVETWLDPTLKDPGEAMAILGLPAPALSWYEVSTAVNSVRNEGPELIRAV